MCRWVPYFSRIFLGCFPRAVVLGVFLPLLGGVLCVRLVRIRYVCVVREKGGVLLL